MCCASYCHPHKMKQLILIILFLLPISSYADYAGRLRFMSHYANQPVAYFDSFTEACNYSLDLLTVTTGPWTERYNSLTPAPGCSIKKNGSSQVQTITVYKDCNGTLTGYGGAWNVPIVCTGEPSCPNGQTFSNGVCQDPCAPLKGQSVKVGVNCSSSAFPPSVCLPNNCVGNTANSAIGFDKTKNCHFGQATVVLSGASCSGQPNSGSFTNPSNTQPPPEPPESDCIKKGQTYGTVNGVVVCVPTTSSGGTPITTSTSTTTKTETRDANGNLTQNQTKTQSETVSQDGEMVNKTTQTKNPDGSVTTEVKQQEVAQFCAENPNHKLCKPKEGEEEEGDDKCEENPDLPQCLALGEPQDGGPIDSQVRNVTYTPVQITSGGSCPPDKTVSIAGKAMTFSYSWLCQYASMFKPFMLAFAYLSAAMFLFSGLRGANT